MSKSNNETFKILFMLSGSIACYKSASAISKLVQSGFQIKTVATPSALKFLGEATLEGLTGTAVFKDIYESGRQMEHIHLARWSDLIIVSPATANTINDMAAGLGSNPVSALALANNFQRPLWICPAMNSEMIKHPATQNSLSLLKKWGARILEAPEGALACGEYGQGRLIEPEMLVSEIQNFEGGRKP
jgi:phosphopantothenoylcysteine synthetase/decarboxylase